MRKKAILLLLTALFGVGSLMAQTMQVHGVIVDKKTGEALIGASILEKGTTNGSITNVDGEFSLAVHPNAVLVASYVGYNTEEIKARITSYNVCYTKLLRDIRINAWLS